MRVSIIGAFFCCICMTSGFHLEQREKRSTQEYFITYVSGRTAAGRSRTATDGGDSAQTVTIQDMEVKFDTKGGMTTVLDFEKMLMTMKVSNNGKAACRSIYFDEEIVPVTFKEITDALQGKQSQILPLPTEVFLNVQLASFQPKLELSPLSAKLCEGLEVQLLELKPEVPPTKSAELTHYHPLRPKREVGWGEVLLIVVIIILL